jgi:transketolase
VTQPLYANADDLELRTIKQIVGLAMDAPAAANSGHPGTAMALAPLGVALFGRVLRHHPRHDNWVDRDRFILSIGHASILQYGLAHCFGYDLSVDDLRAFRQPHSRTPGHPENGLSPTVEVTTGPLGQGLANGVGMAIAERLLRAQYGDDLVRHHTWVIAGDGCLEEGISHEAASLAGSLGLSSLTVIYDDNHITIDGATELAWRDDTPTRFRAYNWNVIEAGEIANDLAALTNVLLAAKASDRPTLIVLRSHIGFPSPAMTDRREAHGSPFSASEIATTKALLGLPDEPFYLEPSVPDEWRARLSSTPVTEWEARLVAAGVRGETLTNQIEARGALSGDAELPFFEAGTKVATRKALQRVIDSVGAHPGIVAGSADLTDNTGVLLKSSAANDASNPSGRQIYYGVREFAMGAVMNGMALHGGIRPIGSTFFVFSDYNRSAIRMAALSHASSLFVFTHDSIGVGEDGPTHQPIEHLMSLRTVPGLHVVRPSDANETLHLVHHLLQDARMPATALVLSRQDLPVLSDAETEASRLGASKGGYVLRETDQAAFTLVGTGSEVGVVLAASELLAERGVPTRVVALPCWACFDEQPMSYRTSVLRREIPSVSLEAGVTLGWHKYVDHAIGVDTFGISAPGAYLFEYFNITPKAVVDHVLAQLERA